MNYFLCLTVEIIGGIATAFAPDIITWSLARFCVGLTIPAILHIPFVMCKYSMFKHILLKTNYIGHCHRSGGGRSIKTHFSEFL